MSFGAAAAPEVSAASSQCPLITSRALGTAGSEEAMDSRKCWVGFHVSAGPQVQSMKKQGPPPWGRKMAGWRLVLAVIADSPARLRLDRCQADYLFKRLSDV